jgi:hypothetical protein
MDTNKLLKITNMYAKTNWRKYFDEDASPAVQQYLSENGDKLYPWILQILQSAVEENLEEVAIIKFTDSKMFATIDKSEYKDLLNKIMEYFIEKEEYEQCVKIRDLIITIDNPPIPKTKRKYTKRKIKKEI